MGSATLSVMTVIATVDMVVVVAEAMGESRMMSDGSQTMTRLLTILAAHTLETAVEVAAAVVATGAPQTLKLRSLCAAQLLGRGMAEGGAAALMIQTRTTTQALQGTVPGVMDPGVMDTRIATGAQTAIPMAAAALHPLLGRTQTRMVAVIRIGMIEGGAHHHQGVDLVGFSMTATTPPLKGATEITTLHLIVAMMMAAALQGGATMITVALLPHTVTMTDVLRPVLLQMTMIGRHLLGGVVTLEMVMAMMVGPPNVRGLTHMTSRLQGGVHHPLTMMTDPTMAEAEVVVALLLMATVVGVTMMLLVTGDEIVALPKASCEDVIFDSMNLVALACLCGARLFTTVDAHSG